MPLLDIQSESESESDSDENMLFNKRLIDLDRSAISDSMLLVHHDQEEHFPKTKVNQISETNSLNENNQVEKPQANKSR